MTHSLETRLAMNLNRKQSNNPFFGKTHTMKTKTLFSKIQSARIKDPNPGIVIYVFSLNNDLVRATKVTTAQEDLLFSSRGAVPREF